MLSPFELLYASPAAGAPAPLPPELATLYGRLALPEHPDREFVIANFVSTLDGVVTLGIEGQAGGGDISGFNKHDRLLMGILRAVADAVVVGAGTLRAVPRHLWTPEHVFPSLAGAFRQLRAALGKADTPLNVIITGSGRVSLERRVFASGEVRSLIVTTRAGAEALSAQAVPPTTAIEVLDVDGEAPLSATGVLRAVQAALQRSAPLILVEGGPQVMGDFFAERALDELFLTLAPQVAGRAAGAGAAERPGFISDRVLAPWQATWGTLISTHRAESHLFLRYRFER